MLTQFVTGFREIIRVNGKIFLRLFNKIITGKTNITSNVLCDHLTFVPTDDPNNTGISMQREIFFSILKEYQKNDKEGKYLNKLIQIITGSPYIPVTGYPISNIFCVDVVEKNFDLLSIDMCRGILSISEELFNEYISKKKKEESRLYDALADNFLLSIPVYMSDDNSKLTLSDSLFDISSDSKSLFE